jgi:hypothetical protein
MRRERLCLATSKNTKITGWRFTANDHYAVIAAPGSDAAMEFGIRRPKSTVD